MQTTRIVSYFILGALVAIGAIAAPGACTSGAQLERLVECKLDALKILPDDPEQISIGDARDIWQRVRACHIVHGAPDGGGT